MSAGSESPNLSVGSLVVVVMAVVVMTTIITTGVTISHIRSDWEWTEGHRDLEPLIGTHLQRN